MSVFNKINRFILNIKLRKKLENIHPSIISCNCVGGVMMHDLNIMFRSPTVNLWFNSVDFIKYVKNMRYYNSIVLEETYEDGIEYPIGKLEDIRIYFQHYHSFQEAKDKWDKRKERIDYNNIFVIGVQQCDFSPQLLEEFSKLEFDKVYFTTKDYNYDFVCCIKDFSDCDYLENIIPYRDKYTGKRYYDVFDYVAWLNKKKNHY